MPQKQLNNLWTKFTEKSQWTARDKRKYKRSKPGLLKQNPSTDRLIHSNLFIFSEVYKFNILI